MAAVNHRTYPWSFILAIPVGILVYTEIEKWEQSENDHIESITNTPGTKLLFTTKTFIKK